MNVFELNDRTTWSKGKEIAQQFFKQTNGESQHIISAVGHCHIDTGKENTEFSFKNLRVFYEFSINYK